MEKRQKVRNDVCLLPAARPRSLHLMPDPARAVQAPSKLHAETKWHFANRFIKIESRELFVSDMKRQAWQQEKIFRYYLFSVSTIDRNCKS